MAPGRKPRKELHQEGFEPNYEDAIRQKKLAIIQSKFAGQIGGSRFQSFVSASTRSKATIDKASQVSEGKGRSRRRCKRVVAPDRQVHGTRITRQRTRELANSNDTTQKGALEDESQAQDEGTRTQEDQRQVQEEGTHPILLAEEVTNTQEEGTPEDESQATREGGTPEDQRKVQEEEVTSTQEEGTPEDQRQVQEDATYRHINAIIFFVLKIKSLRNSGRKWNRGCELEAKIFRRPPARPRAGAELHGINGAIESKLAIRIDEGMIRPVIPIQAAKFATEGGMVLRQHIPVLPSSKEYKMDPSYVCDYIAKVSIVKDACADMLKSGTCKLRYRLKNKYFDGVPANEVTTTSPVSSMTDEQWGKLEICLLNQHNREKVQFNHCTGSQCYIAQVHALRDKYKDEDPTPLELFKEFHSSQKVGFISEPVQKAIDHMEAMMDNPVEEGQEPPSTESAVREVVRSNTFLRVVGISPKKQSRVSRSSQFQDLTWELYLEKVRRDELLETIEQQNLQLADLRKISVEQPRLAVLRQSSLRL
ncbi:hypothetical protein EJB05_50311, partial [Eragrostis curvula]